MHALELSKAGVSTDDIINHRLPTRALRSCLDHYTSVTHRTLTENDVFCTELNGLLKNVDNEKRDRLYEASDARCQRMLDDLKKAGTSKWMLNKPELDETGVPFGRERFREALAYRLCAIGESGICAECGDPVDMYNDHCVYCPRGSGVIARHDNLTHEMKRLCAMAGAKSKIEHRIGPHLRDHPYDLLVQWPPGIGEFTLGLYGSCEW